MLRHLRLGLHRWRHPMRYRLLPALLSAQRLTAPELRRLQQAAFDDLVRFAASHSPFYRERYQGRLPPAGPIDPETLPVLHKADVRAQRSRMLVDTADPDAVDLGYTGGSTGEPLGFYYDDLKHERLFAGMMRGLMMSGWRPGQRVLFLWGASRDTGRGGIFGVDRMGPLAVETAIAADQCAADRIEAWLRHIRRWRPVLLYGYASMLDEVSRHLLERGHPPPTDLLAVYSTAEPLNADQRERMQAAFGCRVFNQYGCREVPNIAWECRYGELHVFSDLVRLETVDGDADPRLLVTSLTDRLMPFIRYALGDTGRLLPTGCRCGSPFPRIAMDLCRQNDLVTTADGRRVHPSALNRLLYGVPDIARYQWVQRTPSELELRLTGPAPLSAAAEDAIGAELRRTVAGDMSLRVRYVDELPPNAAGKHRFVIGLADRRTP